MPWRIALAAALLSLPSAALAQDPCSEAMASLCPRSRGDLVLMDCFSLHRQELDKACPGDFQAVLARAEKIGQGCKADVEKLCKDVTPGDGRVAYCLKQHESELSSSCQDGFNTWRMMRMELTSACAGDIAQLCQDVPAGSGRVWSCLKASEAKLGGGCRDAVKKL
ncbi:MAG: cysteine rich repeat-containing protein [Anaeromyxobacter sp.]